MDNIVFENGKYKFTGFKITKDDIGYDLDLSSNPTRADKRFLYYFMQGVQNRSEEVLGTNPSFNLSELVDVFSNTDKPRMEFKSFLTAYKFPNIYTERKPFIKVDGLVTSKNSHISIVYPKQVTSYGPIEAVQYEREGVLLKNKATKKVLGSLNYDLALLYAKIEKANERWISASISDRYGLVQEIQQIATEAKVAVDKQLEQKIVSPVHIIPDLEKNENGLNMTAHLEIDNLNQDDFKDHFDNRIVADNIYTIKGKEGEDFKVLLDDQQKQILQDVKNLKNAEIEDIIDFIQDPPENWNDELVDMSELYSERVTGWIRVYDESFNINPSGTAWFNDASEDDVSDDITLETKSHEKKTKLLLDLKDNEQELSYEEKLNAQLKGYVFPVIPGGYKNGIQPKDYQKEGIAWLYSLYQKHNPGCILADDMGLGKTFQVLSFIQAISDSNKLILIVAPASLVENWEDEYYHFFNDIRYRIKHKDKNFLLDLINDQTENRELSRSYIVITNYETLRSTKEYLKINWDVVVLDEAQRIKNTSTLTNRTCRGLKANYKIALTGTPVENTFEDVWGISDFANPGMLGTLRSFNKKYGITADTEDDEINKKGQELRKELGITFLRRIKEEMLKDLPEKEIVKYAEYMPNKQETVYRQCLGLYTQVQTGKDILTVLQKIKMASDHYSLVTQAFDNEPYDFNNVAKTILLKDILTMIKAKNEKVIIFAEYIKTQSIIAELISEEYNIRPSIYNGKLPLWKRKKTLDNFRQSNGFNVIIMSPIAAGVGLTITEANHVIHYSRLWNPAREDQATDRVYRIGQTKKVTVYNLIGQIKGMKTFDENLDALLSRKQSLKGAALFPSNRLELSNKEIAGTLMNQ